MSLRVTLAAATGSISLVAGTAPLSGRDKRVDYLLFSPYHCG